MRVSLFRFQFVYSVRRGRWPLPKDAKRNIKMKKQVVAAMVAAVAFAAAAMPTEEEFAKASKEVQAGLKTQMALWQKGDISDSDLAALILVQADKFKDEARRYACLQAAFAASVRAGDVAVAAKALKRIESEVSGFSAGHEKQVINKALARTGKKASEEFRRQLESRLAETGRSAAEIDMIERMKRIEMPVLDFKPPKTLPEVVAYLRQQSIEHGDPTQPEDKRGLSFILKGNLAGRAMPKIHARNISLYNALDLVCQVADCSFSFSEAGGKVAVVIESTRAEDLASGKNPHDIVAFRPPIPRTNAEIGLVGRMKRIVIPSVSFKKATVSDVIEFFRQQSIEHDDPTLPNGRRGMNFVLKADGDDTLAKTPVPMINAGEISLYDAFNLICEATGLTYSFGKNQEIVVRRLK